MLGSSLKKLCKAYIPNVKYQATRWLALYFREIVFFLVIYLTRHEVRFFWHWQYIHNKVVLSKGCS